ncbi:unnamed protein product, partial [Rotaria sp. Silwood1]
VKIVKHLSIEQRWRIITSHFDNNLLLRQIARILQCPFAGVKRILNLYEETNDVLERPDRGRHAIIRDSVRRQFRQILSNYPNNTSSFISTRLQPHAGKKVSASIIRCVRKQENCHSVHPKIY